MSDKLGRPRVPKNKAKAILRGAQYASGEAKVIDNAASTAGLKKSEWIRNATLAEAYRARWVKLKWKMEELDRKLVQFNLSRGRFKIEGVGQFLVKKNPKSELAVEICVFHNLPHQIEEIRYWIGPRIAQKIEATGNPEIPFRVME